MIARSAPWMVIPLLLAGCGPEAGLWVRVEAPLLVPEQADGLRLSVRRASGEVAFDKRWTLEPGMQFPHTLSLLESDGKRLGEGPLELTAAVLLGEEKARPWSEAKATAELAEGELRSVVMKVCDCVVE